MTIKSITLLSAALAASAAMGQQAELTPEQQEALRNFATEINETCSVPSQPPEIPSEELSEERLREVQGEVQGFVNEGNAYLECLSEQEAELGEDLTDHQLALIAAMHNRVLETMQGVANDFNAAVRSLNGKE